MEHKSLPELQTLKNVLEHLVLPGHPQKATLTLLTEALENELDVSAEESFFELMRILNYLPSLLAELRPGGTSRLAATVVERARSLFDPRELASDSKTYRVRNSSKVDFVVHGLQLFDDLQIDSDRLIAVQPDLYGQIDQLRSKVGKAESLSDPSRAVLLAQLDLLSRSVERFQTSGVGPFRDTIFSIYGRVIIQLDADTNATEADKRTIIDDFLRFYSLAQAGGDLLQIAGPAAVKLLTFGG